MIDDLFRDDATTWPSIVRARIATTAASLDDAVYVTVPSYDPGQRYGPCRWMSNAGTMPERGDLAVVAFTEGRDPFIVLWWRPGLVPIAGPEGPEGPQGPQGPAGPTGPQPALSSALPRALGTAAAGTGTEAARHDHVHPLDGLATDAELNAHISAVPAHSALAIQYGSDTVANALNSLTAHTNLTTTAHGGIVASTDARLTDQRVPTDGSVTNAKVSASAAIAESKLALASDAAATTASRRTLGTGALQAAPGNDARFTEHRLYVQSRTDNLITNGNGLLGTNYNFSTATFDAVEVHGGAGSFRRNVATGSFQSDELIPVNPEKRYLVEVWAKAGEFGGTNFNAANRQYLGVALYDVDQIQQSTFGFQKHVGSTDTTLAADLVAGATTMTLTNATGWHSGTTATSRHFGWWPYTNAKGYTFRDWTYTRNYSAPGNALGITAYPSATGAWASGGISGNVVTLTAPWPGPTLPAGTQVRNTIAGGTYKYFANNVIVPNAWTKYSGILSGIDYTALNVQTQFAPGTAYVKLVFLVNYHGAADNNMRYSDLYFGSEEEEIVNAQVASNAAIAYSKLALSGSVVNADISASAAIAKSKLALSNSIANADIITSAAIAYSKLALANSIVNADIAAAAAIAESKLALTAPTWTALAFGAGWTDYSVDHETCGSTKTRDGIVFLKGLAKRTSGTSMQVGILPVGSRPAKTETYVVPLLDNVTYGYAPALQIFSDGQIIIVVPGSISSNTSNYLSLAGISFKAA